VNGGQITPTVMARILLLKILYHENAEMSILIKIVLIAISMLYSTALTRFYS